MPALWSPEDLAARFAPYIEELHDVFVMHRLHYGSPDDIRQLAANLEQPGPLKEELAALVRSIVLREGGSIPRTDLLEIVAISIAGPRMNPAGEELQLSVRQLLAFLHSSLRRPWNELPGEDRMRSPTARELRAEAGPESRALSPSMDAMRQNATSEAPTPVEPSIAPQQRAEHTNVIPFGRARAVFSRLARVEGTEFAGESSRPPEQDVLPVTRESSELGSSEGIGFAEETQPALIAQKAADAEPADQPQVAVPAATVVQEEHRHGTDASTIANPTELPAEESAITTFELAETEDTPSVSEVIQPASTAAVTDIGPTVTSRELKGTQPLDGSALRMRWAWGVAAAAVLVAATLAGALYARSGASGAATRPETLANAPESAGTAVAASGNAIPLPPAVLSAASEHSLSKPSADVPVPGSISESARSQRRGDDDYVAPPYSRMPAQPTAPTPPPVSVPTPQQNVPSTSTAVPATSATELQASNTPVASAHPRDPDGSIVGDLPAGQAFVASSHLLPPPRVSAAVMATNLVSAPKPDYPTLARLAHVDGAVVLHAEITPNGEVSGAEAISGHHLLRHAAEEAVRRWRYRPYEVDGNPVAVSTTVTVRFRH